jgi:erythritol transport system ATP-binding protein
MLDVLRVKTPALRAPVSALSGGNQQKVVIARGVMSRPRVLLMDEPTRGVDVAAKFEILESMRRLAAEGLGIVFATSDLAEVQAVATRVLVMRKGRIAADVAAADATDDVLASAASSAPDSGGGGNDGH